MKADGEREKMQRKHIFVVNGDPYFLELIRELLQDQNYNVTTTNFVPETFEQIEVVNPALIIIDLVVGERAGWELLEKLQDEAETRDIPVLVTSTNPHYLEIARKDEARYGVDREIEKPLDLDDLLGKVYELAGDA